MAAPSLGTVLRHLAHTTPAALHTPMACRETSRAAALLSACSTQRSECPACSSCCSTMVPAELCVVCLQDNRRLAKQFSSGHNEYGYGNQEETLASRRDSATRSAHRDQVGSVRVHSSVTHSGLTPWVCTACFL